MMRQFAKRSRRAASGVIYAAGYAAGTLLGYLAGAMAFGAGCGGLALFLAQRRSRKN